MARGREFLPGPGPTRGPLPWAIPPVVHLAEGKCEPRPTPDASACTQDRTRALGSSPHTLPLAPPGSAEASLGHQPNALFLSRLSWKCCLFSVSPPPRLPVTVSVPAVWLPAAHTPGTSLVKVTVASVPLKGFTSLTWPPCSIRAGWAGPLLRFSSSLALKAVPLHDFSGCPRGTLC